MQYAHNAFGLEGVKGLGASLFMRGSPFLNAAWNGDLDYIKNELFLSNFGPGALPD